MYVQLEGPVPGAQWSPDKQLVLAWFGSFPVCIKKTSNYMEYLSELQALQALSKEGSRVIKLIKYYPADAIDPLNSIVLERASWFCFFMN